jgi:hypothetical protein
MAHVLGTILSLSNRGVGFFPERENALAGLPVAATATTPVPPAAIFKNLRRLNLADMIIFSQAARGSVI